MFSEEEKKDMLADAENIKWQENFRIGKKIIQQNSSCELDEYLLFLKQSQILFPHQAR